MALNWLINSFLFLADILMKTKFLEHEEIVSITSFLIEEKSLLKRELNREGSPFNENKSGSRSLIKFN